MVDQKCATSGCNRRADWVPTSVKNVIGPAGRRRCIVCCKAITEAAREIASVEWIAVVDDNQTTT